MWVKVVGQRSRSNAENRVLTSLLPCFEVKGQGQGQRLGSRSNFWCAAVDIRGSALPSTAMKSHYQSKMFVYVSTNRADAVDRLLISICFTHPVISVAYGRYTF